MGPKQDLVELVNSAGTTAGSASVVAAHAAPGMLHRAFSVLLVDPRGRTLTQQRAATKARFAGRWANTCCGHPRPGESPVDAGARRLADELGVRDTLLHEVGIFLYAAVDATTGLVEREYDHVLFARVSADLPVLPNPDEVSATRWEHLGELAGRCVEPEYAPWLSGVLDVAAKAQVISFL